MSRPSDVFTIEELRDEFDWMFEFNSRMAKRIREDADVHNLVDYVDKLESENAKLRKQNSKLLDLAKGLSWCSEGRPCPECILNDDSEQNHCTADKLCKELGIEVL